MTITVKLPTRLRDLTNGDSTVTATGSTVLELLNDLQERYPGLGDRLLTLDGSLDPSIRLYVNGEDTRFLQQMRTKLSPGDEVVVLSAIAGG
ncbi:MAG: MoaD/ThiS family protein [Armatimonadetes bacterium]|nr:MoaD/ThiS family protein [Armatimonadota bacterium]